MTCPVLGEKGFTSKTYREDMRVNPFHLQDREAVARTNKKNARGPDVR